MLAATSFMSGLGYKIFRGFVVLCLLAHLQPAVVLKGEEACVHPVASSTLKSEIPFAGIISLGI